MLNIILKSIEEEKKSKTFLLHGVTGSGKTEVYLQAIKRVVDLGKQAIVILPEISLTPQTIKRFAERFEGKIAVLHSKLSPTAKYRYWQMIRNNEIKIVIGARSAIFSMKLRGIMQDKLLSIEKREKMQRLFWEVLLLLLRAIIML